jgi:hypothetical protein
MTALSVAMCRFASLASTRDGLWSGQLVLRHLPYGPGAAVRLLDLLRWLLSMPFRWTAPDTNPEQVLEHVPEKSTGFPMASSEPVRQTVQAPEHVPATEGTRTGQCPHAENQTRALLHWLQGRHAGQKLQAAYVKGRAYPRRWSRRGGGTRSPGTAGTASASTSRRCWAVRPTGYVIEPDGSSRRARGYFIPRADNVVPLTRACDSIPPWPSASPAGAHDRGVCRQLAA